jgi:hypothetical protein
MLFARVCAAVLVSAPGGAFAAPQDPGGVRATSLDRVREALETPVARPLTPSAPVRLRPVFKSGVEKHPFVITLDEDLHKTFDLNALQRQSAAWSSQCCGLDLGRLFKAIEKANDERLAGRTRQQIARELAELQAARTAAAAAK